MMPSILLIGFGIIIPSLIISGSTALNVTFLVCMSASTGLAYSYGYFGPAIEAAVDDLNAQYGPTIHFRETNLSPSNVTNCPELDRVTVEVVMNYLYRHPTGIQLRKDPQSVMVWVGNGCSDSLRILGDVAREMNVALISSGGSNSKLNDHIRYPTVFRLLPYQQTGLVQTLLLFLHKYEWKDISLFCDTREDLGNFEQLACDGWESGVKRTPGMNIVAYRFDTLKNQVDFGLYLGMAKLTSRIILLVAHGNTTRDIVIKAKQMGMTNGDYIKRFTSKLRGDACDDGRVIHGLNSINTVRPTVYITTYPEEHPLYGYYKWQFRDGQDDVAKEAFQSLYFVSLRPIRGPNYTDFEVDIKYRTYKSQHYLYEPNEAVSAFTALQYTVIKLVGDIIYETIPDGMMLNSDRGREIIAPTWQTNRTVDSVTGPVTLVKGDRKLYTYVIVAMNHTSHDFLEIYTYDTITTRLTPVPGSVVTWAYRDSAPPNRPHCGFDDKDPICRVSGASIAAIAAGISVGLIVLLAAFFFVARHTKNDDLQDDRWNIPIDELTFPNKSKSMASQHNNQKRNVSKTSHISQNGSIHTTKVSSIVNSEHMATYRGVSVWIQRFPVVHKFEASSKDEKIIRKMKRTTSANLARFYGFTNLEGELGVVCEMVRRGSLLDVMLNESIHFDQALKVSTILDTVKGLGYLHSSAIQYHGFVSATNALADSRFVVKLAYYRLDMAPLTRPNLSEDDPTHRKYFTLAPEQLRSANIFLASKEADIYAFGHLLVHVLCQVEPFRNEMDIDRFTAKDIIHRIIQASVVPFRPKFPDAGLLTPLQILTERCWDDRAAARPTIDYISKTLRSVPGFERGGNFMDDLMRRLETLAAVLETRIEAATRDMMEEKKKAEELLFQVLPQHVAWALTRGEKMDPEAFSSVTIGFTGLEDFTDIAFSSTPLQLVNLLNSLYTMFDNTLQQYDAYKVETISDSYMVGGEKTAVAVDHITPVQIASGLPIRNGTKHSAEVANLSLSLMTTSTTFTAHNTPARRAPLQLKIGFHTGSCVAGIVGNKMPRYCLFGDTINTASRMTSSGQALKIQVSHGAMDHLQAHFPDKFRFDFRGILDIKGKGPMKCYWLLQQHETLANGHTLQNPALFPVLQ